MISREGMETALLLMQLHETRYLVFGAVLGSLAAAGVAWLCRATAIGSTWRCSSRRPRSSCSSSSSSS